MDARTNPGRSELLTTADLAARPEFALGNATINPATRSIRGPGGTADLEPRVMQVLVVLADAVGTVVTRDTLFARCWGNAYVGDDSLNRAVAGVRRIGKEIAGGSFEVETIPRTGYKLMVREGSEPDRSSRPVGSQAPIAASRRSLIGGGLALLAGAGGLGLWWRQSEKDREFDQLMDLGQRALDSSDPTANPAQYFERAAAIRPDSAGAQGRLAYSLADRVDEVASGDSGDALYEAERAVGIALERDPNEPYARLALLVMQRPTLDFVATEDALLEILNAAPRDVSVMRHLWGFYQCVGRSRDSLRMIERALAVEPLASGIHYPRAQLMWILGRTAEADRVIDKAMDRWPAHPFVRFARFTIFAYTGRPRAALAMLDREDMRPQHLTPAAVSLWRVSLEALDLQTPAAIAAARAASLEATRQNPQLATPAVGIMSALGEIDTAFEITSALFALSDPAGRSPSSGTMLGKSTAWRFAPWLFTPSTAALRADPRFKAVCDGIGLTDYWERRKIEPDYRLRNP